ncbi:MAG: 1-acyl-sn-glycerol-3-phosphate acyltransferase [Bacilli bacterium]|nr:1-acyl-sn-glycerol-3-phosphate acyltransferase [Bacilli bacterium]
MKEKKSKIISFKYFLHDFIRVTGLPLLLWFRPKKIYISKEAKKKIKGGVLFISNHTSLSDPLYLMLCLWYRRHHFIAIKELFEGWFNKFLFTYGFLCIPLDRENINLFTFKDIVNHLKMGEAVSMFPEGHVNDQNDGINNFKSGVVMMALKGGVPIVPLYLKRRKHWYSRVVLCVGEAINLQNGDSQTRPTLSQIDEMTKHLYEQEKALELLCEEKGSKYK